MMEALFGEPNFISYENSESFSDSLVGALATSQQILMRSSTLRHFSREFEGYFPYPFARLMKLLNQHQIRTADIDFRK
jgi:hypothetical protein